MTELIDLATLASLGQHFSTVEDCAETKAGVIRLQNELDLIKGFLSSLYGSKFSSLFKKDDHNAISNVSSAKVENGHKEVKGQVESATGNLVAGNPPPPKLRQCPLPPPLQRFNRAATGNQSGRKVAVDGEEKGKKVQRNFLSMSSLKSSPSFFTIGEDINSVCAKVGNGNINSLSISKVRFTHKAANEVGNRNCGFVKLEPPSTKLMRALPKYETEFGTPDLTGQNHENYAQDYNFDETAGVDDYEYYKSDDDVEAQQYEDRGNVHEVYDEMADGVETQMEFQEGSAIYEESFEDENSLELIDVNGSSFSQSLPPSSVIVANETQVAQPKKANGRRVSYSATRASPPDNDGNSNDRDSFLKKCKVCHQEVPSLALFNHVVNDHYKGEVPTCKICKKTFTYRQGLISHMRYHDAGKYDKACSFCGKAFIRRSDVVIHERRLHTGERPYQCPVPQCNQGFVRRYCLLTHVKTNHGEPYMSQIMAQTTNRRKSS